MITFMSDILCVTNRRLCEYDFFSRIEEIAKCSPAGIILREKDLTEAEYKNLAEQTMEICRKYGVPCILHSFVMAAINIGADAIHLPLPLLREISNKEKTAFNTIGASCHSIEDALEAEKLGCTYITAGHIFATDCKKDLPPRGIDFLKQVCDSVSIPVYAIGGITADNVQAVRNAGAKGACIMSGLMRCSNSKQYLDTFTII